MRLPSDLSGRDLAKALAKLGYQTTRRTIRREGILSYHGLQP
jgi:hypothetical protein